ncbi:MAG TPA: Ig-like domain-containing protein, partial [Roseiflexaceae bacterium]|nr:Ig-like domain-containing protein [Roseiflexaceae bacterium]
MRVLRLMSRIWTGILIAITLPALLIFGAWQVVLPNSGPQPFVESTEPANGTADVAPRTMLTLHFSHPMNPGSVEQALHSEPAFTFTTNWNADNTTLTISPTGLLQPATRYELRLSERATSRWFRAIEPLTFVFDVAPAPSINLTVPADGATDIAVSSPILIQFSRPIEADRLLQPLIFHALRFEPPLSGTAIWTAADTLLFRPALPLQAGIRYRAVLDESLADLAGSTLGTPYEWSFSTHPAQVIEISPAAGARLVAPREPLVITFSQPLPLAQVQAGMTITPAIDGRLSQLLQPDGSQEITFTPQADWQPGLTYQVKLAIHADPSTTENRTNAEWSFTTAPLPGLVGRFPGEGQVLPSGQEVRLVFSTPVDPAALEAALSFDPPVEQLRVVGDGDVRIRATVQAATTYTMTIAADLRDRNGVELGRSYRIRFVTAPAPAALELPDAPDQIIRLDPAAPAEILVYRMNLSQLNAELFALDEETALRLLNIRRSDWSLFQPERYDQQLVQTWQVTLDDPLNLPSQSRIAVGRAEDDSLAPGMYFLRLLSAEGPRIDLLLTVARTGGVLAVGEEAIVWAGEPLSATPVVSAAVTLYHDGALLLQGLTDSGGFWRGRLPSSISGRNYIALIQAGEERILIPGQVVGSPVRQFEITATADRTLAAPGEAIRLGGFIGQSAGTGVLSMGGRIELLAASQTTTIVTADLPITAAGLFSATLRLPDDLADGMYRIQLHSGDATATLPLLIASPQPATLRVYAEPGSPQEAPRLVVQTPEGLPVAGASVTWAHTADVPAPVLAGYVIGDDEERTMALSGSGITNAFGQVSLPFSDTMALRNMTLHVEITEPGNPPIDGHVIVHDPTQRLAGIALASRITLVGEPAAIALRLVDQSGAAVAQEVLQLEAYRRDRRIDVDGSVVLSDTLIRTVDLTSDEQGRASLLLPLDQPGEYRIRALPQAGGRAAATTLYVGGRGADGQVLTSMATQLIADRPTYQAGDTATLLV